MIIFPNDYDKSVEHDAKSKGFVKISCQFMGKNLSIDIFDDVRYVQDVKDNINMGSSYINSDLEIIICDELSRENIETALSKHANNILHFLGLR